MSAAAASIEIDPYFYVYTNKFNARRVRLAEYVDDSIHRATPDSTAIAEGNKPDVLRVAGGALGIVTGFLSPSHGAMMIAQGSTTSERLNQATWNLFGQPGKAPMRLTDCERFTRGEQEMTTVFHVRTAGGSFQKTVRSVLEGDELPFQIEALTAENWSQAVKIWVPE